MRKLTVFILLILLAAAAYVFPWHLLDADPDRRTLGWERYWRRAYADFGWTLPGTPDLGNLDERLATQHLAKGAPVLIRIFKREFELEVWLLKDGAFERFATYPICRFSGDLGPKLRTGDRQSPEGFYAVDAEALNPHSRWHRSFNLGFPNAFDKAHGRTGSLLMVHGGCSSIGCYAMTNAVIDEIWTLITAAFNAGQKKIQVQVLPFRMTADNLKSHERHGDAAFWNQLRRGAALFEADHRPPSVSVCNGEYAFAPAPARTDGNAVLSVACPAGRDEAHDAKPARRS